MCRLQWRLLRRGVREGAGNEQSRRGYAARNLSWSSDTHAVSPNHARPNATTNVSINRLEPNPNCTSWPAKLNKDSIQKTMRLLRPSIDM